MGVSAKERKLRKHWGERKPGTRKNVKREGRRENWGNRKEILGQFHHLYVVLNMYTVIFVIFFFKNRVIIWTKTKKETKIFILEIKWSLTEIK